LGYLREDWRGAQPTWRVINAVVAESLPPYRRDVRQSAKEVLHVIGELSRRRRLMRYRRKVVAALER
jgi:hypothetical protein